MSTVFIRIQTYPSSRLPFLFGELRREPWACSHVSRPTTPSVVFGDEDLVSVEQHAYQRISTAYEKIAGGVRRKIRESQHIVAAATASFPFACIDVQHDPALQELLEKWIRLNIEFAKSQWGEQVKSGVLHTDETYPNLHFIIVPENDQMLARPLHPGYSAQRQTDTDARAFGCNNREARIAGRTAYKYAVCEFLDSYHEAVGVPLNFARRGVGVKHVSRAQRVAIKDAAEIQNDLALQTHRLDLEITRKETELAELRAEAERITAQAQKEADDLIAAATKEAERLRQDMERKSENEAARLDAEKARLRKRILANAEKALVYGVAMVAAGRVKFVDDKLNWPTEHARAMKPFEHIIAPVAKRVENNQKRVEEVLAIAEERLGRDANEDLCHEVWSLMPGI